MTLAVAIWMVLFFAVRTIAVESTIANGEKPKVWGVATNGVAVAIQTSKAVYYPGELIVLSIILKNIGTNDVNVVNRHPLSDYAFLISLPNSKTQAPLTLIGQRFLASSREAGTRFPLIQLGKDVPAMIELNWIFDMSLTGKYTIAVTNQQFKAVSNPIEITIDRSLFPYSKQTPD